MNWSLPDGVQKWKELLERYRTVLLVLVVGVALMLLPTGEKEAVQTHSDPNKEAVETEAFDLEAFEERLSQTLSEVDGAGETTVMLTLKSSGRRILAQDLERDGERTVTTAVTVGGSGSGQEVVPLQTLGPQFQGALVVCPGGEDPQVRLRLVDAVAALTGLGSDHISICKRT